MKTRLLAAPAVFLALSGCYLNVNDDDHGDSHRRAHCSVSCPDDGHAEAGCRKDEVALCGCEPRPTATCTGPAAAKS